MCKKLGVRKLIICLCVCIFVLLIDKMAAISDSDMVTVLNTAKFNVPQLHGLMENGSAGMRRVVLQHCAFHYKWIGPDRACVNVRDLVGAGWEVFKFITINVDEDWGEDDYIEKNLSKIDKFIRKHPTIQELTIDFGSSECVSVPETLGTLTLRSWQPSKIVFYK